MPNELNERWAPVPGYEGLYSVSSLGRVRSEPRSIINRGSGHKCELPGKVLKPAVQTSGHLRVSLSRGSRIKYAQVHALVLAAFVGPCPDGAEACHADGDATNNRLGNLRYDSRAANIADSKAHGTFSEADRHPCAILTDDQAATIYATVGEPAEDIARRFGVAVAVVNAIWRGDAWASVTGGANVSDDRGQRTYYRTKLTAKQANLALDNRARRTHRKDGLGIRPTAQALGVDADVVKALYAAVDARKPVIFAE